MNSTSVLYETQQDD